MMVLFLFWHWVSEAEKQIWIDRTNEKQTTDSPLKCYSSCLIEPF